MSSGTSSGLNRERLIAALVVTTLLGVLGGLAIAQGLMWEEHTTYQAVLHVSNWTNRTLNISVFVYGGEWVNMDIVLEHAENVTFTVTWSTVKETVTFIHSVGPGVYNTIMYTMEPGQWRSVVLI